MRHVVRISLALGAALALSVGCDRVEEGRAELDSPLAPEATVPGEPAAEAPERVQPVVMVLAVGIDCAPTAVPFEPGSAQLDESDRVALNALAQCLKAAPDGVPVSVAEVPRLSEGETYDQALAAQRATNVVSFLRLSGVVDTDFEIRPVGDDGAVASMPVLYPTEPAERRATSEPTPGGEPTQRAK